MDPTVLFLLVVFFLIAFFARPLSEILSVPVLSVYILWGILLGPTGLDIVQNNETLDYLYRFGLILMMFSVGLSLKRRGFAKHSRSLFQVYSFNNLLTGLLAGLVFWFFAGRTGLVPVLFVAAVFASSSLEVVAPFLHEFSYRSSQNIRAFISALSGGTLLAELTCLLSVSLLLVYHARPNVSGATLVGAGIAGFIMLVFFGLPVFVRKLVSHPRLRHVTVEDQSRVLILIIIVTVWLASILQVHPMIAAFLAGIALANLRFDRRVLQNISFLSAGIFIPFFFLMVGVKTDLRHFHSLSEWHFFLGLLGVVALVKLVSGLVIGRRAKFSVRESFGFGAATLPHLSSTLATALAGYEVGLLPPAALNAIILLCLLTTITGPVITRWLLFPGVKRHKGYREIEDYLNFDIQPLELHESLSAILTHIRGLEIQIYPVINREGIYRGVLHLSELRDLLFASELDRLVLVADLADNDFPVLYRDEPLEKVLVLFKESNHHAIPVLEKTDEGDFYVGLIMLKDLLPDMPV